MTFYPCYGLMLVPNHTHSATHKVRSLWNTAVSLVGSPHSSGPNQVICTHSFSLSSLYLPFLILSAISHSSQMSCCLVDQVSDTPTPHTSLWLFLHTLDIISPNLCKEPRDSCVSCHPLLFPYLKRQKKWDQERPGSWNRSPLLSMHSSFPGRIETWILTSSEANQSICLVTFQLTTSNLWSNVLKFN